VVKIFAKWSDFDGLQCKSNRIWNCPQITRINANTGNRVEQEKTESTEFRASFPPSPLVREFFICAHLCDLRAMAFSFRQIRAIRGLSAV